MADNPHPFEPSPNPNSSSTDETASPRSVVGWWVLTGVAVAAIAHFFPQFAFKTLVFIGVLSVLVFVHELGHYQFARWAGMKVNRFAVGFPPWIYTKRYKGIDYSIGALPIGGMVDIAGLGSEEEMVATAHGEAPSNPTRPALKNAPHGEKQFQDTNLGWRFMTLFAGPLMNFIYAFVIFIGIYSYTGKPNLAKNSTIDYVEPNFPAAQAGIRKGDKVVAVGGERTTDVEKITKAIVASDGQPVNVTIVRDGKELQLPLKPRFEESETSPGVVEKLPRIGIGFHTEVTGYEKVNVLQASQLGWQKSLDITLSIFGVLKRALTFNLTKLDKTNVGGPVKIAQVIGESASEGFVDVLFLSALLSVNLGLMNLLPFPALDGGRILFLGYELIMRKPLDPRKESFVHMVGMALLLAFMLFITIRDVLPMIRG